MYIRIINNQVYWPYTLNQLKVDEPGISFPETISEELYNSLGVFTAQVESKPSISYTQAAILQDPVLENGKWIQHWSIIDVDAETAQHQYEFECGNVRNMRDSLLAECDWTQGKDIPDSISNIWTEYRQQLRDITSQDGFPFDIEWPSKPA